jgi:threonylcarbamoyladenosine tRNA methylthiotransferase MtaB
MLRILSEKKLRDFYTQNLTQERLVLFEGHVNDGWQYGHTDNYVRVRISSDEILKNSMYTVRLNSINEEGTVDGEIAQQFDDLMMSQFDDSLPNYQINKLSN